VSANEAGDDDLTFAIYDIIDVVPAIGRLLGKRLDPIALYEDIRVLQNLLARIHRYNRGIF
jgi:hypothetical protein